MAYHHGDLPDTLRAATVQLIAERGPTGFSLREVARRAGVSHAAPQHHFGSAQGLLTSVAIEGFTRLRDAFVAARAPGGDAAAQLERCGLAYVRTALDYPGHVAVMLEPDLVDPDDPDLIDAGGQAYDLLVATVTDLRDQYNPDLDVQTAALMCWSLMHGLVELSPKHASMAERDAGGPTDIEATVQQFTRLLIDGFARRPPVAGDGDGT